MHAAILDDAALRTLQNSHRFHLCLSEAEGWGHYIAEALSVGAITLTCDAAPMNELVTAERGLLVAAGRGQTAQSGAARTVSTRGRSGAAIAPVHSDAGSSNCRHRQRGARLVRGQQAAVSAARPAGAGGSRERSAAPA